MTAVLGPRSERGSPQRGLPWTAALRGGLLWLVRQFEQERSQWVLWLPVLLAGGIGLYFSLGDEPPLWLGAVTLCATLCGLWFARARPWLLPLVLALATFSAGFTAAQWRTHLVAAPILEKRLGPLTLVGTVTAVEPRDGAIRVVLSDLIGPDWLETTLPAKARLRVVSRPYDDIAPGLRVRLRAILNPPPEPALPGGYDFARQAYFQGLGAVGFTLGRVEPLPIETASGRHQAVAHSSSLALASLRHDIAQRVLKTLPEPTNAVAVALITGDRGAIPEEVMEDLRASGLAHLLAISGLHMGLVAGLLYGAVRFLFAAVPWLALRYPIKKWAAFAALLGAGFYLLLVGAPIPTQRAFVMVGLVLLAVMLDRRAISLRTVAWAALVVLLIAPESLLSASFQMSFAAVTALIAGYEVLTRSAWLRPSERPVFWKIGVYFAGLSLTSVIAIAATAPFAAYHFNRLALYGLAANLAAIPLMAFWIMPWALISLLLMPLGLEVFPLAMMGWGIDLILEVGRLVAEQPGALLLVGTVPFLGLSAMVLGGLWLCLWRRPWRLAGVVLILAGVVGSLGAKPADVLVNGDGSLMAVRDGEGRLWLSSLKRERFAAGIWMRHSAVDRALAWPLGTDGPSGTLICDSLGCLHRHGDHVVALVTDPRAYAEDCRAASLLISREPVRRRTCRGPAVVIDRFDLWRSGAHAIWLEDSGARVESVAQHRGRRPWVRVRGWGD